MAIKGKLKWRDKNHQAKGCVNVAIKRQADFVFALYESPRLAKTNLLRLEREA